MAPLTTFNNHIQAQFQHENYKIHQIIKRLSYLKIEGPFDFFQKTLQVVLHNFKVSH